MAGVHAKRHSGYGASVSVKAGGTMTEIGGLYQDPVLYSETAELVDVTGHDSPNKTREHIGGLKDGDERTLMFYRDPEDEGQNFLRDNVGETAEFEANHPAWDKPEGFDAVIVSAQETSALEGALTLEVTLKQSGPQVPVVGG